MSINFFKFIGSVIEVDVYKYYIQYVHVINVGTLLCCLLCMRYPTERMLPMSREQAARERAYTGRGSRNGSWRQNRTAGLVSETQSTLHAFTCMHTHMYTHLAPAVEGSLDRLSHSSHSKCHFQLDISDGSSLGSCTSTQVA